MAINFKFDTDNSMLGRTIRKWAQTWLEPQMCEAERPCIFDQIRLAREQRDMAEANLNECESKWNEVCIFELDAAEARLKVLRREAREGK